MRTCDRRLCAQPVGGYAHSRPFRSRLVGKYAWISPSPAARPGVGDYACVRSASIFLWRPRKRNLSFRQIITEGERVAWTHKVALAGALVLAGLCSPTAAAVVTVGPVSVVASDRAAGFAQAQHQAIETAWRQSGLGAPPRWRSEGERERVIRFVEIIEENLRGGYRATLMVGVDLPIADGSAPPSDADPVPSVADAGAIQAPSDPVPPTDAHRAANAASPPAVALVVPPAAVKPVVLRRELYRFGTLAEWVSVTRKLQRDGTPFVIESLTRSQAVIAVVSY